MKFGVTISLTDYSISALDLGRAVEDQGFESIFLPEHSHIPTSRRSPMPVGGEMPRQYKHTLDPFVTLAAIAATTRQIRLGTGVCLVAQRDTIALAKEIASVDFLSGGRFLFGIGGGWNREEMENHGTDPRQRWSLLRERVLALKEIWANDEAEYHGQHVNFDPIWQWPKPIQKPHPPILVGGNGEKTLQRVLEFGDEWMPITGRPGPAIEDRVPRLQQLAEEAGRGRIPVTVYVAPPDPRAIERYAAIGVHRCVFLLPPAGTDEVLPVIRRLGEVVRQVG